MAAIRSKNTRPELALRAALRLAGATGYRLHRRDMPGKPDVAFMRWRVAVFVDGVFWHGHPDHWNPERASSDYWREKISRNIARDRAADEALTELGWIVLRFWDKDVKADARGCAQQVLNALRSRGWPGVNSQIEREVADVTEALTLKEDAEHALGFVIVAIGDGIDQFRQGEMVDGVHISGSEGQRRQS